MKDKQQKTPDPMLGNLINQLKGIKDREFEILGTTFNIEKLPPMAGFEISEEIRINLVKSADQFENGDGSEAQNIALFSKAIMGLHPAFVKGLMNKMFKYVQFQGKKTGVEAGWVKLSGMEDMAFHDFEIVHIYEVLVRALCVNFSGSFAAITSAFPSAGQILKR